MEKSEHAYFKLCINMSDLNYSSAELCIFS